MFLACISCKELHRHTFMSHDHNAHIVGLAVVWLIVTVLQSVQYFSSVRLPHIGAPVRWLFQFCFSLFTCVIILHTLAQTFSLNRACLSVFFWSVWCFCVFVVVGTSQELGVPLTVLSPRKRSQKPHTSFNLHRHTVAVARGKLYGSISISVL